MVTLKGKHIGTSYGGLLCTFGSTFVTATSISESSVMCRAPPITQSLLGAYDSIAVRMVVNNNTLAGSSSSQPFTYFSQAALAISSIYPQAGPSSGGTIVIVTGTGFRDLGGIFCQFGDAPPVRAGIPLAEASQELTFLETLNTTSSFTCTTPRMQEIPGRIPLELPMVVDLRVTVSLARLTPSATAESDLHSASTCLPNSRAYAGQQ